MDQNVILDAPVPSRSCAARTAARQASALLRREGNTAFLTMTLLFALLVTFAWLTLFGTAEVFINTFLGDGTTYTTYFWLMLLTDTLRWLCFILLVLPVFVGRWRAVGLVASGVRPQPIAALYYFSSWQRYRRAVGVGLQVLFGTILPIVFCGGLFYFSFMLYREVFWVEFFTPFAVLLLMLCLVASLLLSALLFIATASYALLPAVMIGNEELSYRDAWNLAVSKGWRGLGAVVKFRLLTLWHVLLSVLGFGIPFVVYYAHHITLSYMRLAMALCPKGDTL